MGNVFAAVLLAAALAPSVVVLPVARGQELPASVGHYHLDVWRSQDGVRLTFASNLVEARDGYLWLSSQSGLTRFDGARFTVFDGSTTPVLRGHPNLETYPLLEDSSGVLWIGTDAGLFTYRDGQVRATALDSEFTTDQINAAAVDSAGAVWAVTRSGRIYRITRDGAIRPIAGTVTSYAGSGVAIDAVGDLWVGSGGHAAFRVHHDTVSAVPYPADMEPAVVVRATADSSVWFGSATAILRWRHGVFAQIPLSPRRALGAVSCFAVAPDGALWIGTVGAGLYRYDGRQFTGLTRRDGLSDDRVVDILIDHNRNIWVATRDGLNRLRPVPFRVVTPRNGLPADLPGAIVQDASGKIWVAPPTGGLFRGTALADDMRFDTVEAAHHVDRVNALSTTPDGGVITGWLGGSVRRFAPGAGADPVVRDRLPPVTDVLEDSGGTWIGTWHGLYRRSGASERVLTTRDGLPDNIVQRVFRDSRGTVWVATQTGVGRSIDASADRFVALPAHGDGIGRALTMFERPDGSVWVGSADGLTRVSGGPEVRVTTRQGLPENWVGAVEDDGAGHLWIAQLGGLTRVDVADFEAVAGGRQAALTTTASYEAIDGMPGGDPSGWAHPWSFRDRTGSLWFAMGHGIAVVDPRHVERPTRPPVMHIEDATIDGMSVPPQGIVTLGPSVRRFEVRYTGVDLTNGPSVRFRYRMDGFDTAWTDAGTQRVASFTRLEPGRYRFRVAGRGSDGRWSPTEARLDVVVEPPIYRRFWFVAAVGLAVALLLWNMHRSALKVRSDAIRDERSRLAREIHDSLLQGFGGIALQLQAASERLALPADQQRLLDRILALADRTLTQAREVVWDIRLQGTTTVELSAACVDAAARILGDTGTVTRVETRGRTRLLSQTMQSEVVRAVEEALTNVRRHADASLVVVTIDYGWRRLRVTVADDGRGFDPGNGVVTGHWGLLGMRERASRAGGRLSLQSAIGKGTVVELGLPYR